MPSAKETPSSRRVRDSPINLAFLQKTRVIAKIDDQPRYLPSESIGYSVLAAKQEKAMKRSCDAVSVVCSAVLALILGGGGCPSVENRSEDDSANAVVNSNSNGNQDTDRDSTSNANTEAAARTIPLPAVSDFATGDDGWRLDGGAFPEPATPQHSDTGRCAYAENAQFAYWTAPAKFNGNASAAYGKALTFSAGWEDACCSRLRRVVLAGGGITISHDPKYNPTPFGSSFWILLDESESWYDDATGKRATRAQIQTVLAKLSQLKLLTGGNGYSWLGDVELGADLAAPRTTPAQSDFTASDENWQLTGGAFGLQTTPQFVAAGGYVRTSNADFAAWIAPAQFQGNFSMFYGTRLTFDAAWDDSCCSSVDRVVLYGGGEVIRFRLSRDPTATFGSYGVELTAGENWYDAEDHRATHDQVMTVLTSLQRVQILAGGNGLSRLDNVVLGGN